MHIVVYIYNYEAIEYRNTCKLFWEGSDHSRQEYIRFQYGIVSPGKYLMLQNQFVTGVIYFVDIISRYVLKMRPSRMYL